MLLPTALKQAQSGHLERLRRPAGRLLRPLPLLAVAGATLVVLGGAAAVIAGCCALLLALDRALPAGGAALPQAESSFRRLVRARRREVLLRRLRGRARTEQRLLCLSEDRGWVALAERRQLGVRAIAVDSIVGTVERNKADAFDSRFRPPRWSRDRWTQIWQAAQRGSALPPISVYRIGDRHFVRDGHHRVSVASALATVDIEADIVELHPACPTSAISDAFDGYRRELGPAERLAQTGDVHLHGLGRGIRLPLTPEDVDDSIDRDHRAPVDQQDRQNAALPPAPEPDRPVVNGLARRWRAWRDPHARRARKARRRREWNEALVEAQTRDRKRGPSYAEIYSRGKDPRR